MIFSYLLAASYYLYQIPMFWQDTGPYAPIVVFLLQSILWVFLYTKRTEVSNIHLFFSTSLGMFFAHKPLDLDSSKSKLLFNSLNENLVNSTSLIKEGFSESPLILKGIQLLMNFVQSPYLLHCLFIFLFFLFVIFVYNETLLVNRVSESNKTVFLILLNPMIATHFYQNFQVGIFSFFVLLIGVNIRNYYYKSFITSLAILLNPIFLVCYGMILRVKLKKYIPLLIMCSTLIPAILVLKFENLYNSEYFNFQISSLLEKIDDSAVSNILFNLNIELNLSSSFLFLYFGTILFFSVLIPVILKNKKPGQSIFICILTIVLFGFQIEPLYLCILLFLIPCLKIELHIPLFSIVLLTNLTSLPDTPGLLIQWITLLLLAIYWIFFFFDHWLQGKKNRREYQPKNYRVDW
ncbi:MAG: hypothetical protein AB8E15_09025 [Bdellovibrionales bacterium]